MANNCVVVTRHPALIRFLEERGIVPAGTPVLAHASIGDVKGKDVIGVLPMFMAAAAASITEIPLKIPAELRGQELTLEQVRQYAGEPARYVVSRQD